MIIPGAIPMYVNAHFILNGREIDKQFLPCWVPMPF